MESLKTREDPETDKYWVPEGLRPKFGQAGKFWERYNKLADDYDRGMSRSLNGNLDVLLIFVSCLCEPAMHDTNQQLYLAGRSILCNQYHVYFPLNAIPCSRSLRQNQFSA